MFFELGAQFSAEPATFNPNQCSPHCPSCFILTRQPVASKTDPDKVPCRPHASPIRILPEQDAVSNMVFNFAALFLNVVSNFPQISHKFPTNFPQISHNCPTRLPDMSPTNSPQFFWSQFLTKPVCEGPRKNCGETCCWSLGNLWAPQNLLLRAPEKFVGRLFVGPMEICGLHKTCF